MADFLGKSHNLRMTLGWGMVHRGRVGKMEAMEDDIFGESMVEERPHVCKCFTVNEAMTERVENIVDLCFRE